MNQTAGESVDTTAYVHADDRSACPAPAFCGRAHVRATPRARPDTGMPDGWRDITMPLGVAALPRTRSGIPITYTVAWSSEHETVLRPDRDLEPLFGRRPLAIFSGGARGEGTPKLDIVSTARARRATVKGLCQICARPLPGRPSPPWATEPRWCGWFTKGQTIAINGRQVPLIIDGWTCAACLRYSLQVCPALVARRGRGTLVLLRVRVAQLVATYERPESLPAEDFHAPGKPARGRREIPVGMVKIAPLDFDAVTPEEVLS